MGKMESEGGGVGESHGRQNSAHVEVPRSHAYAMIEKIKHLKRLRRLN